MGEGEEEEKEVSRQCWKVTDETTICQSVGEKDADSKQELVSSNLRRQGWVGRRDRVRDAKPSCKKKEKASAEFRFPSSFARSFQPKAEDNWISMAFSSDRCPPSLE